MQRSLGDRTRLVESSSPLRAHLHLLSRRQRQEQGEECVSDPPPRRPFPSQYHTGSPSFGDILAMCRLARHRYDLSSPERGGIWIIQGAFRHRTGFLPGAVRIRVARARGVLEAAALFRVTDVDERWQLELVAVRDEADDRAIDAALRCAVRDAGAAGARRLFARMPAGEQHERALRRSGFVPYMDEHVMRFSEKHCGVPDDSVGVRRVHPADEWGVHQLYLEVVPRQVQYAEAMTSRAWDDLQPLRRGMRRASGWVVEEHGRIRGFARVSTRESGQVARLDVLAPPELRSMVRHLVVTAVREAGTLDGVRCLAVIPGYAQELIPILEEVGFTDEGLQTAFVCYTTVPSRTHVVAVDLWRHAEAPMEPASVPGLGAANARGATRGDWFHGSGPNPVTGAVDE